MHLRKLLQLTAIFILTILSALYLAPSPVRTKVPTLFSSLFARLLGSSATAGDMVDVAAFQKRWKKNLEELPDTPEKIPAFFFGHGSPILALPDNSARSAFLGEGLIKWAGPTGPLATFLKDFGPALLKKYQPKGIVVFSAHWETKSERLVTDYGDENPLLMDYFGFERYYYELKFKSRGDSELSKRVVELYEQAGQRARLSPKTEARGSDGRGFSGPGLDHGVFIPFRIMFGDEFTDIPIVEVSIDSSLSVEKNWALGTAVAKLREEGILVLAGGLLIHNLRDMHSMSPQSAQPVQREFHEAIMASVAVADETERKKAMTNLTQHPGFRISHPREEHFVPLYIAAGAGDGGNSKVIADMYGGPAIAFGL